LERWFLIGFGISGVVHFQQLARLCLENKLVGLTLTYLLAGLGTV
jgi:hypothetical protein